MSTLVDNILEQFGGTGELTEATKTAITEAFEDAVNAKASERVELAVTDALHQMDEEHSAKMQQIVEAIDADHTAKLQRIVSRIDTEHAAKLKFVIEKHEQDIQADAEAFKTQLSDQVTSFLNVYVEQSIPREALAEAVNNRKAALIVEKIKEIVSLDDAFINDTIKEAVADGRKTIDNLQSQLDESLKTNIRVSRELKKTKADMFVEQNTAGFTREKKNYVMRMLADKDPDYITENFDYVAGMFSKAEEDQKRIVTEQARTCTESAKHKLDVLSPETIKEQVMKGTPQASATGVDGYVQMMRQDSCLN